MCIRDSNQASTDRLELAKLLNISDRQMSYITKVEAGHGLIKVGSSLVDVYKRQTLVCGGSGAGKTRFYCKPNLMQEAVRG